MCLHPYLHAPRQGGIHALWKLTLAPRYDLQPMFIIRRIDLLGLWRSFSARFRRVHNDRIDLGLGRERGKE